MYTHFGRAGTLMNTGDMSSQARCYAGGRSFLYRCRSRQAPQTVAGSRPPTLPARCRTSVCVCVCVCVYVPCMRMFVRKCMHTQALLYINRNTIKPTIYVCKCKYTCIICICICIICIYACMHVCMYIYVYIHIHTYMLSRIDGVHI